MYADPDEAIDRLYRAFATVPRPPAIDYCPCCFQATEWEALLRPVPLRHLPVEAIAPYAASVLLTVGDVADFRYFLPRLLEIGFSGEPWWPDLEPLVGRLARAKWLTWAEPEVRAVRGVLAAEWAHALAGGMDVDRVLCAIGNAEDDLGPYLAYWTAHLDRPVVGAQLLELLRYGFRPVGAGRRPVNPFWGDRPDQIAQVTAWLASDAVRERVSRFDGVTS